MRKLAVIIALLTIAAFPVLAQPVAGANYHYQQNINCSDCHSMHASAHNNLTDGSAITAPNPAASINTNHPYYPAPNPGPGRVSLLKADDVCESCHKDQTFAPDVYGDNVNGYVRSAGGVRESSASIGGGHLIGGTNPAPGYKSDVINFFPAGSTLECVSCHSPHGSANFRNLVGHNLSATPGIVTANVSPTVAKAAAFDGTKDVTILNGNTYTFGSGNLQAYYGRDAILYSRAATPIVWNGASSSNHMDQFCAVCHGAFHGGDKVADTQTVTNGTAFLRHPTGVATIGSFSSAQAASNLKIYQATATQTAATDSPGCLTCHKAHGNNNPFALIYPSPTAKDTTEEGNGVFKTLCKSCHSMGGSITAY